MNLLLKFTVVTFIWQSLITGSMVAIDEDLTTLYKNDTKDTTSAILKTYPVNPSSRPGNDFKITYRWQAVPTDEDYVVFVHFADIDGKTVFRDDHDPPTPTSKWNGKVEYTRTVPLEQWQVKNKRTFYIGLPEGRYSIYAGLHRE